MCSRWSAWSRRQARRGLRILLLPLALVAVALAAGGACASGGTVARGDAAAADSAANAAAIRQVLSDQAVAWNRGDIEGFMEGYARTDSLSFASGGNVRRGWQSTLEAYRRGYPDRQAMGTLTFSDLDVRVLSAEWALVLGRWHLEREGELSDLGGIFTLVLQKRPAGWRVLHDHTSSP